jgi:hypothetical protein
VLFLSLAWRSNLAVINSQFHARLVVYMLHRKVLGDNIYKQCELGGVTVIRLDIEI